MRNIASFAVFFFISCKLGYFLDIYDFNVTDMNVEVVSLERYRGLVTLIVNVASKCGYTDNQYKGLVKLHNKLKDTNKFQILEFPCNQFWEQEPGSNKEILDFTTSYNVKFPIFSKVEVISRGWENVDPLWQYIGEISSPPTWNFWKYLVDQNGKIITSWGPQVSPMDLYDDIAHAIDLSMKELPSPQNDAEKLEL